MFWRKQKRPLMHCEIVHDVPGRVRIHCRALKYLGSEAVTIDERLMESPVVVSARTTAITANVLVLYEREQILREDVFALVERVLGEFALLAYKEERREKNQLTVQERRLQEEPISELITRVVVATATLVFAWFNRGSAKVPTTFLGRFLTVPALTSLSLALPILKSGLRSLSTHGRPNADTLSSTAILASVASGRDIAALTIIWLADTAELLTAYTMDRTRKAIRRMLSVGEEFVWRIRDDGIEERVALDALAVGDRIMARNGEKISVDGVVLEGEAAVDQASITGEFMPMRKQAGAEVFAGTVVKAGRLVIRAQKVGDQTAVARIVHMVEEATHRKAAIQTIADRTSASLLPINFALALLVYLVTGQTNRALNMLIIDYSCGIRLSTATALSAAICTAARHGILVKGGEYLELLDRADTLVLDKTGTMTEGRPHVTSVVAMNGLGEREVIELAAAAEESSSHPMAVAIMGKIRGSGWAVPEHAETEIHTARGVSTRVNGDIVRVGSRRFMQESGVDVAPADGPVHRLARIGENIVYVSKNEHLAGVVGIQDALRENMKKALNRLRNTGMDDIVLLTGDVEQHAEVVAARMAMDRYQAEVLPDDKAEVILRLQSKGIRVVMVGDGVNDAPALAYADIGVAMGGTRTDIAMEAADITITHDDPLMIPAMVRLSRKTMSIVRQNFATAIGVNTIGIVLASIGVLPVFWGAVLHNACTVAVVGNSSRLLFHDAERDR